MDSVSGPLRRVLVVGVDWIGDVIFSTPLIRALKKRAGCEFLAYSTTETCAPLVERNPYVNRVIRYGEKPFFSGWVRNARFLSEIRGGGFDAAVLLHRSATRTALVRLGGVRRRAARSWPKRDWLLTDRFSAAPAGPHRADLYLSVLGALGIPPDGREVDFFVGDEDRASLAVLVRGTPLADAPYAVVHAGGNWDLKRWPVSRFIEVIEWLGRRGIAAALCGTAGETAIAEEILRHSEKGTVVSLCGRTAVGTLGALIEKSRLVISNDSGPLHVAAGLGVPLVGIYGPTSPLVTGPLSRGHARVVTAPGGCELPCYFERCHHRVCMENLASEAVIAAAEDLLAETAGRRAVSGRP